ncbi:MAG TPA: hypothetical protein IAB73_04655 [Candidatus Onthenecus intestinigallinarum]|uniref:Uncharacterized protein n=1 Tax=Candidatus Onthenecus intestinigallinarum TaxID=2840875 RepID=A0A9D0Z9K1_9FIRM|nr:hypothetical protein [Candidatus Onthenecus intestinigallinarum]
MKKKRLWIALAGAVVLVAAAIGVAVALNSDTGDGYKLVASPDGGRARVVARVVQPEGYALSEDSDVDGEEPEYYFEPESDESPVRFLYYTTGYGDSQSVAEAAIAAYTTFYDEFASSEVAERTLADRTFLSFDYTAAYPNAEETAMVYEQSAVCYFPVGGDAFVVCIVSLSFDGSDAYLDAEALDAYVAQACGAVNLL